jgi:hypothetical protein
VNKIHHQGFFEGSCFLYSIVNTYSALTDESPTQEMWDEAMKWIPFSGDFVTNTGTQRYDDDMDLYRFTIHRLLQEFESGETIELSMHKSISGVDQLKALISESSVVLLNISGDHWVSVVDFSENQFFISCSSTRNESGSDYKEEVSDQYNRKYNLKKRIGKLNWIYHPSIIQLKFDSK